MDYDDYYDEDDEDIYQVGFKDISRVSAYDPEAVYNLGNKNVMRSLSDETKFKTFLEINFKELKLALGLGENDLEVLKSTTLKLKDLKYKNPGTFILGYYSVRNNKINKASFDEAVKKGIPILKKYSYVSPEDVLKYARFWSLHLSES